jgi:hypothetical protein
MNAREVTEACSGHRFAEICCPLSRTVRRVMPGRDPLEAAA